MPTVGDQLSGRVKGSRCTCLDRVRDPPAPLVGAGEQTLEHANRYELTDTPASIDLGSD